VCVSEIAFVNLHPPTLRSTDRALPANEIELTGRRAKPQAATKTYDELQLYTTKTSKPSEKKWTHPLFQKQSREFRYHALIVSQL